MTIIFSVQPDCGGVKYYVATSDGKVIWGSKKKAARLDYQAQTVERHLKIMNPDAVIGQTSPGIRFKRKDHLPATQSA